MTREILAQLPDLRLIQVATTGINNIDAEACKTHGVQLCNVAGYSTTTVPEHTFAMMLAAMLRTHHRRHRLLWPRQHPGSRRRPL